MKDKKNVFAWISKLQFQCPSTYLWWVEVIIIGSKYEIQMLNSNLIVKT